MKKTSSSIIALTVAVLISGCAAQDSEAQTVNKEITTTTAAVTTTVTTTDLLAETTTSSVTTAEGSTTTSETKTAKETTLETTSFMEQDNKVLLNAKSICQFPELPLGDMIVSPTVVLHYLGFECEKTELLKYMNINPTTDENGHWGDPEKELIGDPTGYNLAYASPVVIQKAVNSYLKANKHSEYKVKNICGTDFSDLYAELNSGNPIIFWGTTSMMDSENSFSTLQLQSGNSYRYSPCFHCVVLIGYDNITDTVYVCDSQVQADYVEYPKADVEKAYNQMGKQALVIHKK